MSTVFVLVAPKKIIKAPHLREITRLLALDSIVGNWDDSPLPDNCLMICESIPDSFQACPPPLYWILSAPDEQSLNGLIVALRSAVAVERTTVATLPSLPEVAA